MNCIALLGAGFSRNWGGWLASEAFEYLLGCAEVDGPIRNLLWKHKPKGGFEAALAELQEDAHRSGGLDPRLAVLQAALRQMFADMDAAFAQSQFEFNQDRDRQVGTFLGRFDAIFTLNQDTLLERHYLGDNVMLAHPQRWARGCVMPGVRRRMPGSTATPFLGEWDVDEDALTVAPKQQPFFKLHGSWKWFAKDGQGEPLLVMGGNKPSTIRRFPVLAHLNEQFLARLQVPSTRLMVIGYSFGDDHINGAIQRAVSDHGTKLFIVDPLGVDVIDSNRQAQIHQPSAMARRLWPNVIGSSRRSLREIFGNDAVEHAKVMRFFD